MSALPIGLQLLVWVYFLVAGGALAGCVGLLFAGLVHGRHRRETHWLAALRRVVPRVWKDLVDGLVAGIEFLFYGRPA
jgi:hypothetical protein